MAMIHEITEKVGKHRRRRRIGRGPGSGHGKTAGRGHKGAKSRAGFSGSIHPLYEGGQMPYFRRIPKRGFSNANFRTEYEIVNLKALEARFDDGAEVTPEMLAKMGLIGTIKLPVKVLGEGELTKKLSVTAHKFSASARSKIEAAGGSVTDLGAAAAAAKAEADAKAKSAKAKAKAEAQAQAQAQAEAKPADEAEPKAEAPASDDAGEETKSE